MSLTDILSRLEHREYPNIETALQDIAEVSRREGRFRNMYNAKIQVLKQKHNLPENISPNYLDKNREDYLSFLEESRQIAIEVAELFRGAGNFNDAGTFFAVAQEHLSAVECYEKANNLFLAQHIALESGMYEDWLRIVNKDNRLSSSFGELEEAFNKKFLQTNDPIKYFEIEEQRQNLTKKLIESIWVRVNRRFYEYLNLPGESGDSIIPFLNKNKSSSENKWNPFQVDLANRSMEEISEETRLSLIEECIKNPQFSELHYIGYTFAVFLEDNTRVYRGLTIGDAKKFLSGLIWKDTADKTVSYFKNKATTAKGLEMEEHIKRACDILLYHDRPKEALELSKNSGINKDSHYATIVEKLSTAQKIEFYKSESDLVGLAKTLYLK